MAKPLRSEDPAPQNMQFTHFGVLNDGSQSKTSLFTSITLNVIIALCVIIIGAAAKHTMQKQKLTSISLDVKKPEPEPIKPKIVPKMPPPPPIAKVEPPKIKLPEVVKLPDPQRFLKSRWLRRLRSLHPRRRNWSRLLRPPDRQSGARNARFHREQRYASFARPPR